ncbi:MAG: tetratricopeptide repeat protein [Silvanigrellaceae bacterium]
MARIEKQMRIKGVLFSAIFAGLVACATTNPQQETTRFVIDGNAAALRGDYSSASNQYESALRVAPSNMSAKRNLGIVLVKMGDYKRAIKTLAAVQSEYKDDVEVFYFMGEAARGSGDFKGALGHYSKAAKINPQDLRVQKAISWCFFRVGALDKALNLVQKLQRNNPDDLQVKLIFASVLNKQKKYEEVQALLSSVERANFNVLSKDKVSADTERTLLMNALAESYAGSENCIKADALYNEILKSRPFLAPALIGAAKCDLKSKQKPRATARLERAIKADPDAEEAYFMLGQLYETTDKSKATYFYRRFLLLAKDNPQFISEARITRSNLVNLEKFSSR